LGYEPVMSPQLGRWGPVRAYTCCAGAGGTECQVVVEKKYIRESPNTSSVLNVQVTILLVAYVLTIMFCNLLNRVVLHNFFYELILFY
jgi:hypothetical protein